MRDVGIDLSRLLSASHGMRPLVSAWLGDQLLAEDVPVNAGSLVVDGSQNVPETVTLTVPAVRAGRSWVPVGPADPLAQYGQRLSVTYVLPRSGLGDVAVPLGWFVVQDWDSDDLTVEVVTKGLLQVVQDSQLLAPTSPGPGATLASEFERLLGGLLPFDIDPALVDRPCPRSFVFDEDRLAALYAIADAWPAQMRVDSDGVLQLTPDLPAVPGAPVVSWRDGERGASYTLAFADIFPDVFTDTFGTLVPTWENVEAGTVITAPRAGSRDKVYNAVIVRSEVIDDADRPPVQGFAADLDPSSPTYWFGPYGQVPRFVSSPLVTEVAQCTAMAAKLLRSSLRPTRTRTVVALPDPRVEVDDVGELTKEGSIDAGYVSGLTLPLTADGGEATYLVEVP